jgi:hypothetical protein
VEQIYVEEQDGMLCHSIVRRGEGKMAPKMVAVRVFRDKGLEFSDEC